MGIFMAIQLLYNGFYTTTCGVLAAGTKTDNSIWATVDWTQTVAEIIRKHEYKYVSPVFLYNPSRLEIHEILSFRLTNQPTLELQALNKRLMPVQSTITGEKIMNVKALCKTLGGADRR